MTGIYVPIGTMPQTVQWVIKVFPVSHAALLFRRFMMERPMQVSFQGVPVQYVEDFKLDMGVTFQFGSYTPGTAFSILVLAATAVVFYALAILNLSRKAK